MKDAPHDFRGGVANNCSVERPARAGLVGVLVAALITLPGLGVGTLWDNSETDYSEVAREILLYRDWVVLHHNGSPWFIQPPLYFWIGAILARLFGLSTLMFRLPSAIATIAMGGATAYAVARQIDTRAGIFASIALSSCLMQAVLGRLAIMDAMLDLFVALAIFAWFRSLQTGSDRYAVYGCIAMALGFLAKGPVAPAAVALVVVPYALWNRRSEATHAPSWRGWVFGGLAFCAIVAPWLGALAARSGVHAVTELIGHYTIGRYTGVIESQTGPIWYYVPVLIVAFFPWIAFLPAAIVWGVRQLRVRDISPDVARLLRLALVWTIAPLVFFSFAQTKLANYIALELPALAILVGVYLDCVAREGARRAAIVAAATVPVFIGLMAVGVALFARDNRMTADVLSLVPDLIAMGIAIFVGAIAMVILFASRSTSGYAPYALGAAMLVAMDTLAIVALPKTERLKPVPQLAAVIQTQRRPSDMVGIQTLAGGNALIYYTQPVVTIMAAPGAPPDPTGLSGVPARGAICGAPRALVVAPKKRPPYDPTYGRHRRIIAQSGKAVLFLYDGPGCSQP
jgi:4-amino-4-deoxy-L-arabinose transferase-like glycosyltransferase